MLCANDLWMVLNKRVENWSLLDSQGAQGRWWCLRCLSQVPQPTCFWKTFMAVGEPVVRFWTLSSPMLPSTSTTSTWPSLSQWWRRISSQLPTVAFCGNSINIASLHHCPHFPVKLHCISTASTCVYCISASLPSCTSVHQHVGTQRRGLKLYIYRLTPTAHPHPHLNSKLSWFQVFVILYPYW